MSCKFGKKFEYEYMYSTKANFLNCFCTHRNRQSGHFLWADKQLPFGEESVNFLSQLIWAWNLSCS